MTKKTIFIVDDAEITRVTLNNALSDDYTVVAMDSADKMMKIIQRIMPDLIMMDYYMPGLTFHETMRHLKESDRFANIPVVVMSGSNYPELLMEIKAMGAVGFLSKPVEDKTTLLAFVEKHLQ